jgi:large subunit ribosomal protein L18
MITRQRKIKRVRARILKSKKYPRLSVFRSNRYVYAQIIDDKKGVTLAAFSSRKIGKADLKGKTKVQIAQMVGKELAKVALKKNVKKVVFDRGEFLYHGRVKALAEGAREGGLVF